MKFILALILSIIVALFAIQNSQLITVEVLFYQFQVSQALVILISAIFGAIIAFSIGLVKQFSLSRSLKDKSKSNKQLEYELATTKTQLAETQMKLANQTAENNNPVIDSVAGTADMSAGSNPDQRPL